MTRIAQIGPVAVGVDLASGDAVAASARRFGRRYLDRVFTAGEQRAAGPEGWERLAARFAAKEACLKAIRPAAAVPWLDIEVVTRTDGAPRLVLHRRAADAAREAGVVALAVSLTHERHLAAAVVAATLVQEDDHG